MDRLGFKPHIVTTSCEEREKALQVAWYQLVNGGQTDMQLDQKPRIIGREIHLQIIYRDVVGCRLQAATRLLLLSAQWESEHRPHRSCDSNLSLNWLP